jgi:hypothetical protein
MLFVVAVSRRDGLEVRGKKFIWTEDHPAQGLYHIASSVLCASINGRLHTCLRLHLGLHLRAVF